MFSPQNTPLCDSVTLAYRRVRAEPGQLTVLRRALERWLDAVHVSPELTRDVLLASYEALANAVEHAYRDGASGTLDLEATLIPGTRQVEVAIIDRGSWRANDTDPGTSSRGHGLTLINSLADTATVAPADSGTVVTMRWSI
ncbi:anti sigma factor [Rhodococcus ruber BKS 20-38]|uniref:Anti sigma factor n=1 Tax=Rhodococcus ruber BKS 20-38 TaxID=1278076 RepID=M2YEP3_9NOCA|nr:ATP-binding protein [Rhodococcus ruber]EME53347.1 anti sigma factor [Rhodococcus ruber BKS 20-38]